MSNPTLKIKVLPRFPSSVTVTSPITLSTTGGNYGFGLDENALEQTLDARYAPIGGVTTGKPFVILATGQSFLTQTPALTWTPESNVLVWNWDGVDTHVGTAFTAPSSTAINLARKMASDIARANPARNVYLINISFTGLAISHWLSGAGSPDMFVNIQNNISAALTAAGATQIDMFLWAQGQGDTGPINASYVANHATMMGRFWADTTPGHIWFPKETPGIICSLQSVADSNSLNADADNFNVLLNAVANADPDKRRFCYLSSFAGSTYWDLTAHPTAQGHLSIGAMLASEYLSGTGRNTLQGVTVAPATGNVTIGNTAYSSTPLLVNLNSNIAPTVQANSAAAFVGADGASTFFVIESFGTGVNSATVLTSPRGTGGTPSQNKANDVLGFYAVKGYNSSPAFNLLTQGLAFFAAEDQTISAQGSYAQMLLDPAGSTTRAAAWTSHASGGFAIGGQTTGAPANDPGAGGLNVTGILKSIGPTSGVGYGTGAGGTVTQLTGRTTGVTLNNVCGAITLFAAAPAVGTWVSFTVTNSAVAATDVPKVAVKSGTNTYIAHVTAVAAGSFQISFTSIVGTSSDSPVINFAIEKAVIS